MLGGLVTVATGAIAKRFGPQIGGLFLAFPAIFPASASLLEKHTKKKRRTYDAANRGRDAASLDARGAAMGAVGLIFFGLVVWLAMPVLPIWLTLAAAMLAWACVSGVLWSLFGWLRHA